ncbi:MAG: hypothetical protein PHF60_03070 [Candidatus ainarchaeum sp.]|nr:hypothetical protein [Candidatus ainarchaeum sp.]
MAGAKQKREENPNASALAMDSKFKKYAPEAEKVVRTAEVKQDPEMAGKLHELRSFWGCYLLAVENYVRYKVSHYTNTDGDEYTSADEAGEYQEALDVLRPYAHMFSAKHIEAFCLSMQDFMHDAALSVSLPGLFLSALVNLTGEKSYVLPVGHIPKGLHCLGYHNTKDLVINGNVGSRAGMGMENGSMLIKGDAEDVGCAMKGGTISVEGDAKSSIGWNMDGGEIHVEGGLSEHLCSGVRKGRIYHKGELIVDK